MLNRLRFANTYTQQVQIEAYIFEALKCKVDTLALYTKGLRPSQVILSGSGLQVWHCWCFSCDTIFYWFGFVDAEHTRLLALTPAAALVCYNSVDHRLSCYLLYKHTGYIDVASRWTPDCCFQNGALPAPGQDQQSAVRAASRAQFWAPAHAALSGQRWVSPQRCASDTLLGANSLEGLSSCPWWKAGTV